MKRPVIKSVGQVAKLIDNSRRAIANADRIIGEVEAKRRTTIVERTRAGMWRQSRVLNQKEKDRWEQYHAERVAVGRIINTIRRRRWATGDVNDQMDAIIKAMGIHPTYLEDVEG